jgi:signal transduction histidine kinase
LLCEDITEYRKLQGELRRIEHLSKLGQLSAGMAHEIRNPLAGIAMTAQVLRGKLDGREDAAAFLDRIQEETERLERIVRSLLDFSRPVSPKLANLDLREAAQRALGDMREQAAAAGLILEWPEDGVPLRAWADRDQLQQVLLNLLLNAIQVCRRGDRVGLRLELAAAAGGGARPRLVIYDSGPGVDPAAQERLFDPFYTTKAEGTGLGLAICQKIMEEHGGQIRYRSGPGGGAQFVLDLTPAPHI